MPWIAPCCATEADMHATPFLVLLVTGRLILGCQGRETLANASSLHVPDDVPFGGQCSPDRYPADTGELSILQCCEDGARTWHTFRSDTDPRPRLVFRSYGEPCREADGMGTNCGAGSVPFRACAYGPCGAKSEWQVLANDVYVFEPRSTHGNCGWETRGVEGCFSDEPDGCQGWVKHGDRDHPEPYGDQPLYETVTGSCPFVGCRAGGIPVAR